MWQEIWELLSSAQFCYKLTALKIKGIKKRFPLGYRLGIISEPKVWRTKYLGT